jgi:DNA-binding CsgD family transcriptional regulator
MVSADAISMDLMLGNNQSIKSMGAYGFDQATVDAYSDYYFQIDPRMAFIQRNAKNGVIIDESIRQSSMPGSNGEFWSWLGASGAPSHAAALVLPCVDNARIVLAFHREKSDFQDNELTTFLTKFYDKFTAINCTLRREPRKDGDLCERAVPLQHIGSFKFCLDDNLIVSQADGITRYMLALTGLARLGDELQLEPLDPEFHTAILSAVHGLPPQGAIQLTHKSNICDTLVSISTTFGEVSSKLAEVSITYVKHAVEQEKVFMAAFGLTQRQAQLLKIIQQTYTLEDAARLMSITKNTARVFLGQIYDRTGVHSRFDLLRLVEKFA